MIAMNHKMYVKVLRKMFCVSGGKIVVLKNLLMNLLIKPITIKATIRINMAFKYAIYGWGKFNRSIISTTDHLLF
jgi:hypothetical protein